MSEYLAKAKQRLEKFKKSNSKNFHRLGKSVDLIDANESGKFKFKLTVEESHTNLNGTIHGAYIAFLVDDATGVALVLSAQGSWRASASIGMNINYVRTAKVGDVITVETECKKVGSTLAFLEATILNAEGEIIATATHSKYIGKSKL